MMSIFLCQPLGGGEGGGEENMYVCMYENSGLVTHGVFLANWHDKSRQGQSGSN